MADAYPAIGVYTITDGAVVVGIATGQTVGITGTVNTAIVSALPAGTNTIGDIGAIVNALPTGSNTIGSIASIVNALPTGSNTIGSIASIVNALPTGSNTIGSIASITNALPTGTNTIGSIASIVNALPAGTNTIGKVEIDFVGTTKHIHVQTATDVPQDAASSVTVNSTAITNGTTGELRLVSVGASVAMKFIIRKDNTITPVVVHTGYIPAGGGTVSVEFPGGGVTQAGTAAGENFDVVFWNLDTKSDAEAHATFTWTEA